MVDLLKKHIIPLLVFITGACVLIIEVTAIRILSPYFGNTIYTVSSVLSVVLAALSAGYFFGGKLADKYTKENLFFGIIAASGVAVLFLHVSGSTFLTAVGYKLSIVEGPIIASLLLFFLQSFLLGMLSPLAVALHQQKSQTGVGNAAGQIFFWSTLGSIAGSLCTGFYLIPHFGINAIMLGVGFVLLALGIAGLAKVHIVAKVLSVAVILAVLPFLHPEYSLLSGQGSLVYAKDSLYQKIVIYDGLYNQKPTRFLLQDKNSSAAMYKDSSELVYPYTRYYELYKFFSPKPKQALVIGGGAYSIPKAILEGESGAKIDVAEIDPLLIELVKKYFNVPDDPRLTNYAGDGRRFLYDTDKKYDIMFSDAYASLYSTPEHLTTKEFFMLAKEKLNNNGVFMANVVGSLGDKPESFLLSEMKTFISVFPNSYFFAVASPLVATPQNIIFIGYNSEKTVSLPLLEVQKVNTAAIDFSRYPLLTDNYAPVDYLVSKEFTNYK